MLIPGVVLGASRDGADVPAPAALLPWGGLGAAPKVVGEAHPAAIREADCVAAFQAWGHASRGASSFAAGLSCGALVILLAAFASSFSSVFAALLSSSAALVLQLALQGTDLGCQALGLSVARGLCLVLVVVPGVF